MAFSARSVVVTGANSGIGRATALELARSGYDVIGTARTQDKAAELREQAAAKGLRLRTVLLEVTDAESTREAFAEVERLTGGGPWAVVNNAGIAQPGAIEDVPDELVREQLEVNLIAPMRIAREVLPGMRARGDGRIVTISSVAGRVSTPLLGWYAASKFGLEGVTDALRVEVEPFGVKVVLVEPGVFGSTIWQDSIDRLPAGASTGHYAAAYRRARGVRRATALMPDPVWVARVVRLALGSAVPLPRYLVGVDAVGAVVGSRLVPTAVSDLVKGLATGTRRVRLPWQSG